ncbi:MAG: CPBP family intramembrane metalloprotease [Oscillospiraceae bacterium]|nr:CPBP family intramembrane metalloprotease [Oscillospiraceae bacterium]
MSDKLKKFWLIIYPVLIFVGAQVIVGVNYMFNYFFVSAFTQVGEIDYSLILLLAGIVNSIVFVLLFRRDLNKFPESAQPFRPSIYVVFLIFGICLGISLQVFLSFINYQQYFPDYEEGIQSILEGNQWFNYITVIILAPICEELCFRGIIFKRMRTYFGLVPAVIVSSLLFGLIHINPLQILYAGALGVVMALVYHRSGKIMAPILIHAGFNSLFALGDILEAVNEISPEIAGLIAILFALVGIGFTFALPILLFKKIPFWKYKAFPKRTPPT